MKIVHIITRLILGGAQENTLITCRELAKRGHEVILITGPAKGPEGQLFDSTEGQGYKVITVNSLVRAINPIKDILAYRKIKKILRSLRPDIVHTHSAKAGILGRYAGFGLKGKSNKPGYPKVIHTIHGLAFHPYLNRLMNRFYIAIERATAKKTDAFISVADAMTEKALAAGINAPAGYTTAYSAIEEDDYLAPADIRQIKNFRRKYGISEEAVVIVKIARLAELKGHEYVIESAKKLSAEFPDCIWLMVGDGNLADQIKRKAQMENVSYKFKFIGLIDPTEIPLALHSSDILVHCSLREGLARALPQAMLAGKPVISFDIDGAREVVNSDTGRLIEPENVEDLTKACRELIADSGLREQLGLNGRALVRDKFAPETMTDTIEAVYNKLIKGK